MTTPTVEVRGAFRLLRLLGLGACAAEASPLLLRSQAPVPSANLSLAGSDLPVKLWAGRGLEEAQVRVELAANPDEPGYAFEKYAVGEPLEGRTQDGKWIPVVAVAPPQGTSYDVHVSDDFPGSDLPRVPAAILRRPLVPGQADYLVDNSELKARGLGLKYRHSKNVEDKSDEYAPWGTLIIGEDEGDGWVKVSAGYLPFAFRNATVLVKREREGQVTLPKDPVPWVGEAQHQGPEPSFEVGDAGEFRSRGGSWYPCRITGEGLQPSTYNLVVLPDEYSVVPVVGVEVSRLRRVTPPRPHRPQHFPAPDCQGDGGCLRLRVATKQGRQFMVQVSRKSRLDILMKMICTKLEISWESCQTDHSFKFQGKQLRPWTSAAAIPGLRQEALVVMLDVPSGTDADA